MSAIAVQGALESSGAKPVTRLTDFEYTSLGQIYEDSLGLSSTGLYLLNVEPTTIDKFIVLPTTDLGIQNNKRVRYIYVGVIGAGTIQVKGIVDKHLAYEAKARISNKYYTRIRIPWPRYMQGRYWQFTVSTTGQIQLDDIDLRVMVLSSGVL